MSVIQSVNKTLIDRVSEVEIFCHLFSDIADDFISSKRKLQDEISHIKSENTIIVDKIQSNDKRNIELHEKYPEVKSRSMEYEMIFFGVDEARTNTDSTRNSTENASSDTSNEVTATEPRSYPENTEAVLRKHLKDNLEDNQSINSDHAIYSYSLKFDEVFRVGNPNKTYANGRPMTRPIEAKFENFSSRELVRCAGIELNKAKTNYKIYEHFSKEIEERRKKTVSSSTTL